MNLTNKAISNLFWWGIILLWFSAIWVIGYREQLFFSGVLLLLFRPTSQDEEIHYTDIEEDDN